MHPVLGFVGASCLASSRRTSPCDVTAASMSYPSSLMVCADQLFVADTGAERIMVFQTPQ